MIIEHRLIIFDLQQLLDINEFIEGIYGEKYQNI